MPENRPRNRVADPARPTVASLGLQVRLISKVDDAEFMALIERYEQLLCDWEHLSHSVLKALADRSHPNAKRRHALRQP